MQEGFSAVFIRASEQKSTREAVTTSRLRFALRVFQFEDNDAVPSRENSLIFCVCLIYTSSAKSKHGKDRIPNLTILFGQS